MNYFAIYLYTKYLYKSSCTIKCSKYNLEIDFKCILLNFTEYKINNSGSAGAGALHQELPNTNKVVRDSDDSLVA